MSNIYQALVMSAKAAMHEWRYVRYLQAGGNPDQTF